MPSVDEFKTKRRTFTHLVNGHFGAGKTQYGMTYPKVYAIEVGDPSGLDVLYKKGNEKLLSNLVWYEYLIPKDDDELRDMFRQSKNSEGKRGKLYAILDQVWQMADEGKIETILFDGFTYFTDLKWRQINLEEVQKASTGNIDTQAMYRNLGLFLHKFVASDLLSPAVRRNLNVIVTCHLKRLSDDEIEGTKGSEKVRSRAGTVNQLSDLAPMIEGGFRQKAAGLFGASIFLERKMDGTNTKYIAHLNLASAMSTIVDAKSRYSDVKSIENPSYETFLKFVN